MKIRKISIFAGLLALLTLICFVAWGPILKSSTNAGSVTKQQQAEGGNHAERDHNEGSVPYGSRNSRQLRLSFPDMAVGQAATIRAFPRGANERRRYPKPESREVIQQSNDQAPLQLAMWPEDGRTELLEEEIDTHTRKGIRLAFNGAAIQDIIDGRASRLMAPTPDGKQLELRIDSIQSRSPFTNTLIGKVVGEDDPFTDVQLVYHEGVIHGTVARYNDAQHLEYRILEDGHMMVRELELETMTATCANPNACADCGNPDHGHGHQQEAASEQIRQDLADDGIAIEPAPTETADQDTGKETPGSTTVDVVVGYGAQARAADGGITQIEARIISAIDRMNTSFQNSLILNTEMMLLGTIEDPDYNYPGNSPGDMREELKDLDNENNGPLDTVSDYANLLGADFQAMVIKSVDGGAAGIAYRPGHSSVTARDYITSSAQTFAHELGHNLGCDHSWGDSSQKYHDRYGWRLDPDGNSSTLNDRVRTIMAYDWNWGAGQRIPHYANPDVNFGSAPTGAPLGFDATGDPYSDPRYVIGGLGGYPDHKPNLIGFNGTKPNLGARNALNILNGGTDENDFDYGAAESSSRKVRTALDVPTPLAGLQYNTGQYLDVFYTGADHEYTATVELYKGASLVTTIASGVNCATTRNLRWLIPGNLDSGSDYFVRVTVNHPDNPSNSADSGFFTIGEVDPRIIAHTPSPTPSPINLNEMVFTFNEVMDQATFSIADDIRSFNGPNGVDLMGEIIGANWSTEGNVLTISFSSQSDAGFYRMVLGPYITDLKGNNMDQDVDETNGELIEDSYVAIAGLNGSGPSAFWSDMIGPDAPDAGWRFPVGGSWQVGTPAEVPPTGPDSSFDGGAIIATNLSGDYAVRENTFAESPWIDCTSSSDVILRCKVWYGAEEGDVLYIDAHDGTTWNRIFEFTGFGNTTNSNEWVTIEQSVAAYADGNPNFRLRWGLVDFSEGTRLRKLATGWQIDRVELLGTAPAKPIPAPIIFNDFVSGGSNDPQSRIFLEFSSTMDQGSFSLDDISSFTGPSGSIAPSGFTWLSDSLLQLDFPEQATEGTYSIVVTPDIQDTLGKSLDQDLDGTDGEPLEDDYTASFTIGDEGGTPNSIYITWSEGTFSRPFALTGPNENPDGDLMPNFMEFAFGTDPTVTNHATIVYVENGNVITTGAPKPFDAGTPGSPAMRAVFGRRKDHVSAGLTYEVQFSANLTEWVTDTTAPTTLTSDPSTGDIEAVYVPFPATIDPGTGEVVPRFFRVDVTMN